MADLEAQIRTLADRRFADTDPVAFTPDETMGAPPTPLSTTNARPIDGTEIDMRPNETQRLRRERYAMGAVAAAIAIAIVGVALIARDDDPEGPASAPTPAATAAPPESIEPPAATEAPMVSEAPATTALPTLSTLPPAEPVGVELDGAAGDAEAKAAFAVVVDAYEAFNTGDAIAWRTASETDDPVSTDLDDPEMQYLAASHAAGARYEVLSCSYEGVDEDLSATGHRFTCQTRYVDAFTTAAGIDYGQEWYWTVADGQVIDADAEEDPNYAELSALRTFAGGMSSWMRAEHPDISFTMIRFYNYPLASEVPDVLPLLGDYLAASDDFPLAGD